MVGVGMVDMSEIETVVHILNLAEDNYRKAERVGSHLVAENQARGEKIVKTVDEVDSIGGGGAVEGPLLLGTGRLIGKGRLVVESERSKFCT